MPAYPKKINLKVNGQDYYIRLFGDESHKRAETEDGYTIVQNERQQWCYAEMGDNRSIKASHWLLGNEKAKENEFKHFLETIPHHLDIVKQEVNANPETYRNTRSVIGQRKMLIILMGYKDLSFSRSKSDFERLFNENGYSDDSAQGSVKDYYLASSYNQLQLESDIYGPYTTSHNMAYYGKNSGLGDGKDANTYSLFEEAITSVANETDLSLYDGDGDGIIDNVHIIFAGYGEEAGASQNAIWSHESTFYRPYKIQGLKIDRYSCAPELRGNSGNGISRIGPHCHEIGHALGAMDYYDTNYSSGGEYIGTGKWDVMADGSWNNDGITPADFNPYVKAYDFGWISPKTLPIGKVSILPSNINPENYYILKSSEYGDFYLLENRSKKEWGNGLPGEGLLIYHIHSDIVNSGNEINVTAPQMCYIVCASSHGSQPHNTPTSYGNINSGGCPYPGNTYNRNFGQSSKPTAFYWDNEPCGIELNNIKQLSDGSITLTNNSVGAAYEPVVMRTLFFEGFEDEASNTIKYMEEPLWKIEENPENTISFIYKPVAYAGVKCLQLSADSQTDVTDTLEFACTPHNAGRMRIRLYVASLHLRFNKPNTIKVGYRIADDPDWQYTIIQSTENNRWMQSYIELPDNTDSIFKIIGIALKGSIVAIDNIEIEQVIEKSETGIHNAWLNTYSGLSIFSLSGIKQRCAHKGINIVKDSNGNRYKILTK